MRPSVILMLGAMLGLAACDADAPPSAPLPASTPSASHTGNESGWSAPVNLGATINSAFNDLAAELSGDGLSLYFGSNRPGGFGANDIYVAQRPSVDAPWGPPVNLGAVINTAFGDAGPSLSRDGHYLYFTSARNFATAGNELFVSYRQHTHDDFGWEPPVNLGPPVNTTDSELGPNVRRPELYFWKGPPTLTASPGDIYVARMIGSEFEPPAPVEALNSPQHDENPAIRFDGREIFIASDRPGGAGSMDLWVAFRDGTGLEWSTPVNLGPGINTASQDRRPGLSSDGRELFFDSDRPGGFGGLDLYVSRRTAP